MSWFRVKNQKPDFTGLQIQTSVSALPVPIVWGQTKAAANVVFYANFQTQNANGGGKGGLFSSGSATTSYSADLILALCEGPIAGIGFIWKDQSTYTLSQLGLTFFNGATPQSASGYLASTYPTQSLAYQGTSYVCAANYNLGANASIGNHNFEIIGRFAGTGVNGVDADPALVINDFLTNPQYGAGFAAASINAATLFGSGGDSSLQTYCKAIGIAFSPALTNQEQASSVLARWLQICNCAAVWSQGQLKFIPYDDATIAGGNVTRTTQVAVPQPGQTSSGSTPPPSITVCASGLFVADGGVVYAFTGVALAYIGAVAPSSPGTYGVATNGTYLFASGDEYQVVRITYTCNVGASYVPNVTPVYDLTDLDFVDARGGHDPVQAARVDPFSLPNIQRVETLSRANQYGATPVEARDQGQIELFGPRVGSTIQAHEICDDVTVGPIVAQTILQRTLYIRAHFQFTLSWEYSLLDPMDVVTITDSRLGLAANPVRVLSIEEDDNGSLGITAEELTTGLSTPALYPGSGPRGFQPNRAVAAAAVNTPLIFEPPPALTNNVAEVWIGASGGAGGVADPNWGGCNVWISLDGVTYSQIATITQPLRQGVLAAGLAAATGWDAAHTLATNLTESAGVLSGTSSTAALQGSTLALVEAELLAYESAALAGPHVYNLTGLARGLYGSGAAAHASGAAFARLDSAVVKYALPANAIGQTLYFKFQSFNVFGAGLQSIAAVAVYPYTPNGAGEIGPVASTLALGAGVDFGSITAPVSETDDWGNVTSAYVAAIDLGNVTT